MKIAKRLAAAGMLMATGISHAALLSLSNATIANGASASTTLSLTGDGVSAGLQADVVFPSAFTITSVSAGCTRPPGRADTVRFIRVGGVIPTTAAAQCQINFTASGATTRFIPLVIDGCFNVLGNPVAACFGDPAHITVTP
jgi:hypothetical protein